MQKPTTAAVSASILLSLYTVVAILAVDEMADHGVSATTNTAVALTFLIAAMGEARREFVRIANRPTA